MDTKTNLQSTPTDLHEFSQTERLEGSNYHSEIYWIQDRCHNLSSVALYSRTGEWAKLLTCLYTVEEIKDTRADTEMPIWECKYLRMSVNSSSLFFFSWQGQGG